MAAKKTTSADERGRAMAQRVLKLRKKQLNQRAAAFATAPAARPATPRRPTARAMALRPVEAVVQKSRLALGPAATGGVVVAEGDSWFDYPLWDVLKGLEDVHGFEVESVAHMGDRVEEMAYADGQLDDFVRLIDKVLRRGEVPRAILLSGGGNDIAGDAFEVLLNHFDSPSSGVNTQVMAGVIDVRLREAYDRILSAIAEVCRVRLGNPLPVIVHGYDYPVADGRGFLGGWWLLPGPWLEPGFRRKGYQVMSRRQELLGTLIDRFNTMLQGLVREPRNSHVTYVDLRNTLSVGPTYKNDWGNELHPTAAGFAKVTAKLAGAIP
jgi:hypothetical protein